MSPVEAEAVASSSACWGSLLDIHDGLKVGSALKFPSGSWREQLDKDSLDRNLV